MAVLPQPRKNPLSFESNHSRMFFLGGTVSDPVNAHAVPCTSKNFRPCSQSSPPCERHGADEGGAKARGRLSLFMFSAPLLIYSALARSWTFNSASSLEHRPGLLRHDSFASPIERRRNECTLIRPKQIKKYRSKRSDQSQRSDQEVATQKLRSTHLHAIIIQYYFDTIGESL